MKTCLSGFFDDLLDSIHQHIGSCGVKAVDIVQTDIAKAAFTPVKAMSYGQFIPASIAPNAVHRIEHFTQRQVFPQWQAIVDRCTDIGLWDIVELLIFIEVYVCLAILILCEEIGSHQVVYLTLSCKVFQQGYKRTFAVVQTDKIDKFKHARVFERAQFGIDKPPPITMGISGLMALQVCAMRKAPSILPGKGTVNATTLG